MTDGTRGAVLEFEVVGHDDPGLAQLESEVVGNPPPAFSVLRQVSPLMGPSYLLARVDGEPVGAAVLLDTGPELHRLYVASKHQGRTIGQTIVEEVFRRMAVAGETDVCVEFGKSSQRFWAKVGDRHPYTLVADYKVIFQLATP